MQDQVRVRSAGPTIPSVFEAMFSMPIVDGLAGPRSSERRCRPWFKGPWIIERISKRCQHGSGRGFFREAGRRRDRRGPGSVSDGDVAGCAEIPGRVVDPAFVVDARGAFPQSSGDFEITGRAGGGSGPGVEGGYSNRRLLGARGDKTVSGPSYPLHQPQARHVVDRSDFQPHCSVHARPAWGGERKRTGARKAAAPVFHGCGSVPLGNPIDEHLTRLGGGCREGCRGGRGVCRGDSVAPRRPCRR